ncbi:MAG: BCCT family transporter, partial [Neisseriaceae bacterium]|nr:BCCT family transporter [Neisseriaceae bacterium]
MKEVKYGQRDTLLAGLSLFFVFISVWALAAYPDQSIVMADKMMFWATSVFTAPVLLFAFLAILFVLVLAFSKYGKIKLGAGKPEYST